MRNSATRARTVSTSSGATLSVTCRWVRITAFIVLRTISRSPISTTKDLRAFITMSAIFASTDSMNETDWST